MARILSVVWFRIFPAKYGGQKGIAGFNNALAQHHELHCLCAANNEDKVLPYPVSANLPISRSQIVNPFVWFNIVRKAHALQVSHIILEHCYYGIAGIWAKKKLGITLVLHEHNIEWQRFKDMGKWWWPLLRILEKHTSRQADILMYKTQKDRDHAIATFGINPEKCVIIPYGLSRTGIPENLEREMARRAVRLQYGIRPEEKILLFSGTLDYTPNALALKTIVLQIIPLLEQMTNTSFRVIACGRIFFPAFKDLLNLSHPKYIYAGALENADQLHMSADLFINPVITGGGIKVKTLESIALNLTVVSTVHGAEGIDLNASGSKLWVSEDGNWPAFCRHILDAWDHQSDTPEIFFKTYHWNKVIQPLLELMKRS